MANTTLEADVVELPATDGVAFVEQSSPLTRLHYFDGQFLRAASLTTEQDYHRHALQRANLAMLDDPAIAWTDSCAAADHPMIDHIWGERRAIGRISLGIGGVARRLTFSALLRLELGRHPAGLDR